MRNFVAKNDFNKSAVHKDLKNDYNRNDSKVIIEEELDSLPLYLKIDQDYFEVPDFDSYEEFNLWLNKISEEGEC